AKASEYGLYAAAFGLAVVNHHRTALEVVVIGDQKDERTQQLLRAAYGVPRAGKRVLFTEPEVVKASKLPPGLAATLPNLPLAQSDLPMALVCLRNACKPPVRTPEELVAAVVG
ncbi:MAG: hypothetical protein ACRD2O_11235, partial [Terriglobia bacterium]